MAVDYAKGRLGADGKMELYDQKIINPDKCPHFILAGDHYRQDGTCRCNDITHTEMDDWGYEWNSTAQLWEAREGK